MPTIKVPKINIPKVNIPETPYVPDVVLYGENPACDLVDRDLDITKNHTIIFHRRKEFVTCPNGIVTTGNTETTEKKPEPIRPIIYDATDPIPTEGTINFKKTTPNLNFKQQQEETKTEEVPCPPKNAPYRTGDWRNELRLERLLKYERGSFEGSCNAVWEKVPFRESFIGTPETLVSTTIIGVVAGGSALLAPLIKKLISTIFKKLKKKISKEDDKK